MDIIEKAREFATKKHKGMFRKNSVTPYITHPERVADLLDNNELKVIAWLHDILEDTHTTYEEIVAEFGETIARDVRTLTHCDTETYDDYIERISTSPFMRQVKVADIVANLTDDPTEKQIRKYVKALQIMSK